MRKRRDLKREELKPEYVDSAISEKLKGKKTLEKNISAASIRERKNIEDPFKEYPYPPDEHAYELEMEKRLKRFHSGKARFLEGALNIFFKREFPKLLGPILRQKLVKELIKLMQDLLPLKEHVKPGQIVWSAVSTKTRADSPNVRFVPVT